MATTNEGIPATGVAETRISEPLSNDEILRYSRHLIMPEVAMEGQQKLKAARVLCIGAGGLGSPLALYLAAAGVGTMGLVDFDVVDYTNLQRQVLHHTSDVGRPKLDSAIDKLNAINPFVQTERFETLLNSQNALEIFRGFDIIADGTDNFRHAIPGQRCLRAERQAERVCIDLPLRRAGQRLCHQGGPVLPLSVSGAATAGAGSFLRRGRSAGRASGAARGDSGN